MKKIYHLSSCNTCRRIIGELDQGQGFELQDIKSDPLSPDQLDFLYKKAGSYEALFSRRAQKYKAMGLADKTLTEADYRRLILEDYTFLKRPVVLIGEDILIGNASKTVAAAKAKL